VQDGSIIPRFGRARRDPSLAVLEGFHPLKHALRFGANLLEVVSSDAAELDRLASLLAPDLSTRLRALAREVDPSVFTQLAPLAPSTGVMGLAERPSVDPAAVLADQRPLPVVLLEDPRDLGNMGACVRFAAAADVGGVLTTGSHDPWHPDALRGAAGLHYAVPVSRLDRFETLDVVLDGIDRPLLAIDPEGDPLDPAALPARAVLAFGTERYGLSPELTARADARLSIPMRPGVSSLNLATSVAAVLFAWRLSARSAAPAA
jgi:RNA methyltransferase, TrmH family